MSYAADAVVFAIGIGGMQKLVTACPTLAAASEFRAVMNLKSLDVIATRLWLDRKVNTRCGAAGKVRSREGAKQRSRGAQYGRAEQGSADGAGTEGGGDM